MTATTGAEVTNDAHSFDAFGKPRGHALMNNGDKLHANGDFGATTEHGFTGHEHLDDTYLIHMNGRVYDYRLGRFLSVDPVISGTESQALNPYTYVGNNPLSGVDPTGYEIEKRAELGSHIMRATKESVLAAVREAKNNGTITDKTSVADASKAIKSDIASAFYGSGMKFAAASAQSQGTNAGNGAQRQGTTIPTGPSASTQNPAQTANQPPSQPQVTGGQGAQSIARAPQNPAAGPPPTTNTNAAPTTPLPPNTRMEHGLLYNTRNGTIPAADGQLETLLHCMDQCVPNPFVITSTSESLIGMHQANTPHGRGEAADLRLPGGATDAAAAMQCASNCGARYGQDEYNHPSPHANGPHVHVQLGRGINGGSGDLPTPRPPP